MTATTEDQKAKLLAERKKLNAKATKTAADKKRLTAIATALEGFKADAFKRLGAMRVTKSINAMRGLQKLANRNNYAYTQEQVDKILEALKTEIQNVNTAFNTTGGGAKETFSL
jgi:hypothetical protein